MHRRCNMSNHSHYKVGCDAHKRYSVFAVCDGKGKVLDRVRVNHERGAIQGFLSQFPSGTPVALETVGNWYWIVDEIEVAGCVALLAHAGKAKAMMGHTHKTDKLDAEGLATLLHNGTLPTVWIPPGETQRCMQQELELLDQVQEQIHRLEARILERVQKTPTIQLIQSVPGPAEILSIVIDREVGSIDRFPSPKKFCGYAGTVPKVKGSGGKYHYGRMIKQANNYLKWAFIEAANVVVRQRQHPNWRNKYVVQLYERTCRRKGHAVAVGAMARYLAEATYWVLKKGEPYREPVPRRPVGAKSPISPRQGQARAQHGS